jgi:hypothetical protein
MAAPKQMNMLVRRPAGLCLISRSRPITPPRNAARTSRTIISDSNVAMGVWTPIRCQKPSMHFSRRLRWRVS